MQKIQAFPWYLLKKKIIKNLVTDSLNMWQYNENVGETTPSNKNGSLIPFVCSMLLSVSVIS
jgi:hypothetical protein